MGRVTLYEEFPQSGQTDGQRCGSKVIFESVFFK